MTVNDQDAVIVRALVELGRSLGLRTVAEGVESPDAQALLRELRLRRGARATCSAARCPPSSSWRGSSRQQVRRLDRGDEVVPFNREKRRAVGERRRLAEAVGSDQRPGVAPAGLVDREAAGAHEGPGSGLRTASRSNGSSSAAERVGQLVGSASAATSSSRRLGHRLAAELPDHRAELELLVEHQPVVDALDAAVEAEEAVAALAVGVVADEVEGAHGPELVVVRLVLVEREVVLLEVGVDEPLQRAHARAGPSRRIVSGTMSQPSASDSS